jgi:hypothetical protein
MFVIWALGVSALVDAELIMSPVIPWEERKHASEAPAGPVPTISTSMSMVSVEGRWDLSFSIILFTWLLVPSAAFVDCGEGNTAGGVSATLSGGSVTLDKGSLTPVGGSLILGKGSLTPDKGSLILGKGSLMLVEGSVMVTGGSARTAIGEAMFDCRYCDYEL